jgi:hypothetical protein
MQVLGKRQNRVQFNSQKKVSFICLLLTGCSNSFVPDRFSYELTASYPTGLVYSHEEYVHLKTLPLSREAQLSDDILLQHRRQKEFLEQCVNGITNLVD